MSSALHSLSVSCLSAVYQRIICALTICSSIPLAQQATPTRDLFGSAQPPPLGRYGAPSGGVASSRGASPAWGQATPYAQQATPAGGRGAAAGASALSAMSLQPPHSALGFQVAVFPTSLDKGHSIQCQACRIMVAQAGCIRHQLAGFRFMAQNSSSASVVVEGKFLPEQGSHAVQMATPMTFTQQLPDVCFRHAKN